MNPRTKIDLTDLEHADPTDRIVVGLEGRNGATELAHDLIRLGIDRHDIRVDHPDDLAVVGRGRQRDEADNATVSLALGNQEQLVPGWAYSAAGFAVGFVIGAIIGPLFTMGDTPVLGRAALVGLCFGLGGAAIGFVWGLSRGPELAGQGRDAPMTSVLSLPVRAVTGHREAVRLIGADPVTSWWLAPEPDRQQRHAGTARHPDGGHVPAPGEHG